MNSDTNVGKPDPETEWKRAMEKYPFNPQIDSPLKPEAESPYNTAEANFPTWDKDPFTRDMSLPKHTINLDPALKEMKEVLRPLSSDENLDPQRKKVEETKEMLNNFKDKVAKYPKRISYEGSMVLCVLLSLSPKATSNITGLPTEDQRIIAQLLPEKYLAKCGTFEVKFDDQKDFILIFTADDRYYI